ncbi:TPA: hypothetical protein I4D82_24635 [Enterobacter cloacae]|nr:hypothetical protein [Enterobacter cloacae]
MKQAADFFDVLGIDGFNLLRYNPAPRSLRFIIFKREVLEHHPANIRKRHFQIEVITYVLGGGI